MRKFVHNGSIYQIPNVLNPFQEEMYLHLINWKWRNVTEERGIYIKNGEAIEYDAILPDRLKKFDEHMLPHIYPPIRSTLARHQQNPAFAFKIHPHFYHMSSSQAANANLFLPILNHPNPAVAEAILSGVFPQIRSIARDHLDHGFQLEYWGAPHNVLGDHNERSGTDADIAIAFIDREGELCLWLVEHKLCEAEFTECGGYKSENRIKNHQECDCTKPMAEILKAKHLCYYHAVRKTEYWNITERYRTVFEHSVEGEGCPFLGGMNQLWRIQ